MKDILPSTTPGIPMDRLDDMLLYNPAGIESQSILLSIIGLGPGTNCKLWNKHQDDALLSEVGVDGVPVGPITFPDGKFGNAVRVDGNGETVTYSAIADVDWHSYILSWWAKTDYSVTDGYPSDAVLHYMFANGFKIGGVPKWGILLIHITANRFYYHDAEVGLISSNTIDWGADEWHHFAVVVDRHANFDGDKTMAVYVDANQEMQCNLGLSDWSVSTEQVLRVGTSSINNTPLDGEFDNPTIFSPVSAATLEAVLEGRNTETPQQLDLMGYIYDSENIFNQSAPVVPGPAYMITIENTLGNPERIPMDSMLTLHWFREPDEQGVAKIRLPQLNLPGYGGVDLYIATDGSVYWDQAMTQIACTPKMYYAKT